MPEVVVKLTEAEFKVLELEKVDVVEWVKEAVQNQLTETQTAVEDVVLRHCYEKDILFPKNLDEVVSIALSEKLVTTAKQRQDQREAEKIRIELENEKAMEEILSEAEAPTDTGPATGSAEQLETAA